MNFERRNWVDEAVQYPDRFTMQSLAAGMVNLTPSPGTVDTVGTPQSAVNFNHLERGILDTQTAFSLITLHLQMLKEVLNAQSNETTPEIGTVTLTNTLGLPFNNSTRSIPLTKPRKTMNYGVEIISAIATDAKPIGDIRASARQLNGFNLAYSGSSSSVTLIYRITGGITV